MTKEQIEQLKQQLAEKKKEVKAIEDQLKEVGELEVPEELANQVVGGVDSSVFNKFSTGGGTTLHVWHYEYGSGELETPLSGTNGEFGGGSTNGGGGDWLSGIVTQEGSEQLQKDNVAQLVKDF